MTVVRTRFRYPRRVHFYETDLMKIVHHANYLKFAEEARVAWAFAMGVLVPERPEEASKLAVLKTAVHHVRSLKFGDGFEVELQVKRDGIRIVFEYKMWKVKGSEPSVRNAAQLVAEVLSIHVAIRPDGRPEKPDRELKAILENEQWTETWLSNL